MPRYFFAAIAALGLGSATAVSAQLPASSQSLRTHVLQPDLVAVREAVPAAIAEAWSATNPCTQHSHTYRIYLRVKGRFGASTPAPTAILYRDGQPVETWALSIPSGSQEVTLGSFTWTKDHPCPSGSGATFSTPPQPNYRLVVDPQGKLTEMSETNNVVEFHLNPGVPFVRAP